MSDPELDAIRKKALGAAATAPEDAPKPRRGRKPKAAATEQPSAAPAALQTAGQAEPQPNPRAVRETRAETTRRERRNRDPEALAGIRKHLRVPKSIQEDAERRGVTLRWVKADTMRAETMIDADWDPTQDADGKQLSRASSRSEDVRMVLMEKPNEWIAEERRARARHRHGELHNRLTGDEDPESVVGYRRGNNTISQS